MFTSNANTPAKGDWVGLQVHNSSSVINNCVIEYCFMAVEANNFSPVISHNILREIILAGIQCFYAAPQIYNNEVYNLDGGNNASIGIWVGGTSGPTYLECNNVHNCYSTGGNAYGIYTSSTISRNNVIHDIYGGLGQGIEMGSGSSVAENNYVYNTTRAIAVSNATVTPYAVIKNNTVMLSTTGIQIWGSPYPAYNPTIVNNIIVNNHAGIYQDGNYTSNYPVTHNLVWNNTVAGDYLNVQVAGIGQIVGTNINGDPIDSYWNLSQDPLFSGGTAPVLSSTSPCINAGDTTYSANIGFDTAFACVTVANSIPKYTATLPLFSLFPVPANETLNLICTGTQAYYQLNDILGNTLRAGQVNRLETFINISDIKNGVYFLKLDTPMGSASKKFVVQH